MKYLMALVLLASTLFAISPFSLEGIKEVNVVVLNKGKVLSEKEEAALTFKVKEKLHQLGIKTESEHYSNFLVKIQAQKFKDSYAVLTGIAVVEDVIPYRDQSLENIGITYQKNDFFDTSAADLKPDIYESILDYLMADFMEQYREENE